MKRYPDTWLSLAYLLCASLSLVILTSISPGRVAQQALMFGLGLVLYLYLSAQESAIYKTLAFWGYILSVVVLGLTLLLGETVRGSTSWIRLGEFQFQTGEFVKPLLVMGFAFFLTKFPPKNLKNIALNLGVLLPPVLLVFRQPDLGTAVSISMIWITQIFISGISYFLIALALLVSVVITSYLPRLLHDYQLRRIESFINPSQDPLGSGYNVIQSIIAVGSGGILGKGLGQGTQSHLRFLPERHTDFIFAASAEELGLIGSIMILLCLGGLLYRLLYLATHTKDQTSSMLYLGTFGYLFFQTFINLGMNIGIAPVTGVTLPLISYGGSSILSIAISLGIASSCARGDRTHSLIEIK